MSHGTYVVLVIDGPWAGRLAGLEKGKMRWDVAVNPPVVLPQPLGGDLKVEVLATGPGTITYYVHFARMFGKDVAIGSTHPHEPDAEDAIRYMLSNGAKMAIVDRSSPG